MQYSFIGVFLYNVHIVPTSWKCAEEFYGQNNLCDCGCGAFDPDCNVVGNPVLNCLPRFACYYSEKCVPNGECVFRYFLSKNNQNVETTTLIILLYLQKNARGVWLL